MFSPYIVIIGASLLIALSYIFDKVSKNTRIPSVLFLISTGIMLKLIAGSRLDDYNEIIFGALELLGIIGLIMIVLEAAVDLKLSKKKAPTIVKSLFLAIIVLVISSLGIAMTIHMLKGQPFFNSLIYAIPLSVVSSAVLIPSVHTLTAKKREFMIYESTFSDIAGIMFFNYIVLQEGKILSPEGMYMILLTILVSFIVSYALVYFFSKIRTGARLFMMLAILALLYAIGKKLDLSALLIILIFGLVLNNVQLFFRGKLAKALDFEAVGSVSNEFRLITSESAFVVRTFFFVTFGLSIELSTMLDPSVLLIGSIIVIILYLVRYVNFRVFLRTSVFPEIFLAPRGLITILLFFSIPAQYLIDDFSIGILFFVILATSIIMMIALIKTKTKEIEDFSVGTTGGIVRFEPQGPHCEITDDNDSAGAVESIDDIEEITDFEVEDSETDKD